MHTDDGGWQMLQCRSKVGISPGPPSLESEVNRNAVLYTLGSQFNFVSVRESPTCISHSPTPQVSRVGGFVVFPMCIVKGPHRSGDI